MVMFLSYLHGDILLDKLTITGEIILRFFSESAVLWISSFSVHNLHMYILLCANSANFLKRNYFKQNWIYSQSPVPTFSSSLESEHAVQSPSSWSLILNLYAIRGDALCGGQWAVGRERQSFLTFNPQLHNSSKSPPTICATSSKRRENFHWIWLLKIPPSTQD